MGHQVTTLMQAGNPNYLGARHVPVQASSSVVSEQLVVHPFSPQAIVLAGSSSVETEQLGGFSNCSPQALNYTK